MQFALREMTPHDVRECFDLVCTRPGYKERFADRSYAERHCDAWRKLLGRSAVVSGVLEGTGNPKGKRILSCGFAAFLRIGWWERYLADPFPNPGAFLLDEFACGRDEIILTDHQLAHCNSTEGLLSLTVHVAWALDRCSAEDLFAMKQYATRLFLEAHAGFRMREFLAEVFPGPEYDHYVVSGAWQARKIFGDDAGGIASILVGRSREEVTRCPENVITALSPVFVWRTPRFCFAPEQQRFLKLAREHVCDKDLAAALGIGTSAVARRFDRIYRRVEALQGTVDPVIPEGVALTAKRRLLLDYLRENLHELRPYSVPQRPKGPTGLKLWARVPT